MAFNSARIDDGVSISLHYQFPTPRASPCERVPIP
jgi:hypothetical protein